MNNMTIDEVIKVPLEEGWMYRGLKKGLVSPGVYIIFVDTVCAYIGSSKCDVNARATRFTTPNYMPHYKKQEKLEDALSRGIIKEVTILYANSAKEASAFEKILIQKCNPLCNITHSRLNRNNSLQKRRVYNFSN